MARKVLDQKSFRRYGSLALSGHLGAGRFDGTSVPLSAPNSSWLWQAFDLIGSPAGWLDV